MNDNVPNSDPQQPYDQSSQQPSASQPDGSPSYSQQDYGRRPYGQYPPSSGDYSYGQPQNIPDQYAQSPYGTDAYGRPYGGGGAYGNAGQPQYGYTSFSGQPYAPQGAYYGTPANDRWNVLCIVGFVLSFIVPPVGLILSIIALVQINRTHEKSRGMSIAGIIIGAVFTVLCVAFIAFALWMFDEAFTHSDYTYGDCAYTLDGRCYDYDDADDYIEDYFRQYGEMPYGGDFDLGDLPNGDDFDLGVISDGADAAYVVRDTPIA